MRSRKLGMWLCAVVIGLGWLLIFAALGMIAAECLLWLRDDTWTRWSVRDVAATVPDVGRYDPNRWMVMRGVDSIAGRILSWIGPMPASLALLLIGTTIAWTATGVLQRAEARVAEHLRRMRRI